MTLLMISHLAVKTHGLYWQYKMGHVKYV